MVCELALENLEVEGQLSRLVGNERVWRATSSFLDYAKGMAPMAISGPVPKFYLRKGGLVGLRWVADTAQWHNEAGFWVPF